MGTYYHIVAGSIYLFAAYMLYTNAPEKLAGGMADGIAIVAALYGLYRIVRGVMNIIRK
jgi:hypothetical protein